MVGGSSRIPSVQKMLSDFFNGKKLNHSINPDEAVAYGATVQASILGGEAGNSDAKDIVLLDVIPLSIGVAERGVNMEKIINRNRTIPCKESKTFSTGHPSQTTAEIAIYQGESQLIKNNLCIGNFNITIPSSA